MNNQKGFANIIILILVVVALAGIGSYFVLSRQTPPPSPTITLAPKALSPVTTATPPATPTTKPISEPAIVPTPIPTPTQTPSTKPPTPISTEKPLVNNSLTAFKNIFVILDDGTLISPQGQVQPLEVAKKFYNLNPDKKDAYDLLTLFTSFHDPNTVEYHMGLRNNINGIGRVPTMPPVDIAYLPSKLVGISFVDDAYSPEYNNVEAEIKNNLFLMVHETGHQWLAYIGKDEGISDGVHYSKWVSNGFLRDGIQWGDVTQGWPWKDNGDGTVSVKDITHSGFSNFSLYMMGLISSSEVPDLQIVVPNDPANKDLNNVPGTFKTIQIKDLIAKYGERAPSYLNSQKDFNMAYILVVKKGQTQSDYEPYLNVVSWVAKYFPDEWNYVTYGKSTINKAP